MVVESESDVVPLREARDATLVDNTAQAVFKHLDRLEDNRRTFGARWVWELLQNARDAASVGGVSIQIRLHGAELEFEHDGAPFRPSEIAHLIYHGSTKVDGAEDLDHFGSGFLSSHLLSRRVRVRGGLIDGRQFGFELDRSGRTTDELRDAMNESWEKFEASLAQGSAEPDGATVYSYPLGTDVIDFAREGLSRLRAIGPLVLAFSPEIGSITIVTDEARWSAQRGRTEPISDHIELLTVTTESDGVPDPVSIAIAGDPDTVQVVLPLSGQSGALAAALGDGVPRLFVMFPLVTTERLPLPAVVNSKRLKPREDRDGIVLDGESDRISENKTLLDQAGDLTLELLECGCEQGWLGLEALVRYDERDIPDWVDDDWFQDYRRKMIDRTRELRLVRCADGTLIPPSQARIPCAAEPDARSELWQLEAESDGGLAVLPELGHSETWFQNLRSWQRGASETLLPESLTVGRLSGRVDSLGSIEALTASLIENTDPYDWLRRLLTLVADTERALLDRDALLPNQAGVLKLRTDVLYDDDISDELKTIAESFDLRLRDGLFDARAGTDAIINLLGPKHEDEAVQEVLEAAAQAIEEGSLSATLATANAKLLWWLAAASRHRHHIDGYQVVTAREDTDRLRVVELKRAADRAPLAPPSVWPESAARFAPLFPRRKVLHDVIADSATGATSEAWADLRADGYVRLAPLYSAHRRVEKLLVADLQDRDDSEEHEAATEIAASDIAFLTEEDVGLIDTARKSRQRAIQLIEFLVTSVLTDDVEAFDEVQVKCSCGEEHAAFTAAWLKPLHDRSWVPVPSGRGSTRVSAEALANLLGDRIDLVSELVSDSGGRLLRALGISPADFQLRAVATDEEQRITLVRSIGEIAGAVGGDIGRVEMLAKEIGAHPEIVDAIEKGKAQRAKVKANQEIGRLVEELLRDELRSRGLTVERTGVGSDYEVESDVTDDDGEVWFELRGPAASVLVEIKSARSDRVRMTPVQAETANREQSRFALCIVPLPDDVPTPEIVREQCRFVFDIGRLLTEPLRDYISVEDATAKAREHARDIAVEIHKGEVRFAVGEAIWAQGLSIDAAVDEFATRAGAALANRGTA